MGGTSGPHGSVVRGDGAAYDPARRAWRRLPPAPLPARVDTTAVWTGREVLSLSGRPAHGPPPFRAPGFGYDPAGNRWRQLADGPLDPARPAALWTGAALLIWNPPLSAGRPQYLHDGWPVP